MNHIKDKIDDLKAEANGVLREKLQKGWSATVAKSKKTGQQIDSYAKENPWTVGAIALAVGMTAGYLMAGSGKSGKK